MSSRVKDVVALCGTTPFWPLSPPISLLIDSYQGVT